MEFGLLMTDKLVYVSCKFEMYIFNIALVISGKCTYCVSLCTEYILGYFIAKIGVRTADFARPAVW